MIKIISNKKYKKIIEQNDRLTKQILKQQNELNTQKNLIKNLSSDIEIKMIEITNSKKEMAKLKRLLTKNKISYKKEEKGNK